MGPPPIPASPMSMTPMMAAPPMPATAVTTTRIATQGIDVRDLSQHDRKNLARGPSISIFIGANYTTQIPQDFYLAMSNKPCLISNGFTTLPLNVEVKAVKKLAEYINSLLDSPYTFPRLQTTGMDIHSMLSITHAGDALGVKMYFNHAYTKVEAILHRDLPLYKDLHALLHYRHFHDRLFGIAAENLAIRL